MAKDEKSGITGLESFSRLQEEHAKAVKDSQEVIEKWERFRYDYEVLQSRLETLPDSLTHDVMVPFGKFGFMRGHLYHTNEVMVLLGDNWFARRTAKQATEIAERRNKYVCEMMDKEKKVLEDLQARSGFVRDISTTASQINEGEGFEIREDYDPVKEDQRREAKKKDREKRRREGLIVPPPRPAFPKRPPPPETIKKEDEEEEQEEEEMWRRLEKMEKEEEEERDETIEEEKEEKEDVKKDNIKPVRTITFMHSSGQHTELSAAEQTLSWEDSTKEKRVVYLTPGDVGRISESIASERVEVVEKGGGGGGVEEGVAKRGVRWNPDLVSYSRRQTQKKSGEFDKTAASSSKLPPSSTSSSLSTPFSSIVLEKESSSRQQPATDSHHQLSGGSRKVSKFKSTRASKS